MGPSDTNFTVLSPMQFLEDVETKARQAKKRFYAQAMEVEPEETISGLFTAMTQSAKEGIDTRLNVDYYSFLITDGHFNYLPSFGRFAKRKEVSKQVKNLTFEAIRKAGGRVTYINPPKDVIDHLFPVRSRNHMKLVIIDDTVWIGGVNFRDLYFRIRDFMVRITDGEIAETLTKLFHSVEQQTLTENTRYSFHGGKEELFIDSGVSSDSLIMDEAIELVKAAKKRIRLASAFIPSGRFLKHLIYRQKEGITIDVVVPSVKVIGGVFKLANGMNKVFLKLMHRSFPIHYKNVSIHAKLLIIDDEVALFGSHNFSDHGVMLKTAELAMLSHRKELVDSFIAFHESL